MGKPNNAGTCKHHRKRDNMQFLMTISCVYGMNLWCMSVEMRYQSDVNCSKIKYEINENEKQAQHKILKPINSTSEQIIKEEHGKF